MRFLCFIALFFLGLLVAGLYGALHDQISFTISPEYFTEFKYRQFGLLNSDAPDRFKAAQIGFRATWWMGVPIGLAVGVFGFLHKPASRMFWVTVQAFAVVAVVALLVGLIGLGYGWLFASHSPMAYRGWYIPASVVDLRAYLSVGHMHNFGYIGGLIGMVFGVLYQFFVWWRFHRQ